MAFRIWSRHFPGTNAEYVLTYGIFPARASPAAIPIMLASAIPMLKNRSGYRSAKRLVFIETEVSDPSTTILGYFDPITRRDTARAARSELIYASIQHNPLTI